MKERILQIIEALGITVQQFELKVGLSNGAVSKMGDNTRRSTLDKISIVYPNINISWLLTGEGSMLNNTNSEVSSAKEANMIPFFDDVYSVGGDNEFRASVDNNGYSVEMVNTGDWFKSATAAIRHVGDSMVEYPAGSILAVRRVDDINLLVNGKAYVIETTEYRVTKLIRDEGEFLMAYSTNTATHPDGSLIYAPMRIPKNSIRRIDIVLGCVNIEQGTLIELNTK